MQHLTVFISIFIAEIGDKTQIATMLFATDQSMGKWTLFLVSASALAASSALAVIGGELVAKIIPPTILRLAAGVGFVLIGFWTIFSSMRSDG